MLLRKGMRLQRPRTPGYGRAGRSTEGQGEPVTRCSFFRSRTEASYLGCLAVHTNPALAGDGLVDDAQDRRPLEGQGDKGAEQRLAGDKALSAVDRVQDPDILGVGAAAGLEAALLAEDSVAGERLRWRSWRSWPVFWVPPLSPVRKTNLVDYFAHDILGLLVRLGHR